MSNISKIKISGTSYDIKDENACNVVELTQAEYDALPTSAKTSNSLFVITDATSGDLSNYYTKSETSGATEISTALASKADTATTYTKTEVDNAITAATASKQDTLVSGTNIKTINNESILGSGNINIQGGGGKAIKAGRGISITSGETADTVSFNLPISAGTGANSIVMGEKATANGAWSFANGNGNIFYGTSAGGERAIAIGYVCNANGLGSIANGQYCTANGIYSHAIGSYVDSYNDFETSIGKYNVSSSSNNTLFSVGNGTADNARHNAFEIRQNGDIYITKNGQDVKLQDQLGGGGSDINVVQTTGTSTTDVMSQNAVTTQLSGYVTTDTLQDITAQKTFVGDPTNKKKSIKFKQYDDASKVGFVVVNSASTNNEVASFEFRPNTFTIDNVQHPLMYFGHYRSTKTANAGVPQTVIGFRQYDQLNAAAYHYLLPLPEKAKTPFNLTTSFNDYYAPIGFKNGSTMITADNTGVVDLSSELGGLKLVKLTQAEYDVLTTKDDNTVYFIGDSTNGYTMKIGSANVN